MAQGVEDLVRRPWRDVELPSDVFRVPTMLSRWELRLLYWLAREYARGDGAIVDAGCFLGGSTAALLAGIRDRREKWNGPPVSSYDRFRVEAYTIPKYFSDDPEIHVGDSFRDRFDKQVAPFAVPHQVHEGNIIEIGWDGGPIEVLFLDVLKSWKINDAVVRHFFRSLIPGRSIIVHQDYGWGGMPWIPITVELMRDSLVLLDWMEWGSHVFFVEREVPGTVIDRGVSGLDFAMRFDLLARAIERADGWIRGMLELDRTSLIVAHDGLEAGLRDLGSVIANYRRYGSVVECGSAMRADLQRRDVDSPEMRRSTIRRRLFARNAIEHLRGRRRIGRGSGE